MKATIETSEKLNSIFFPVSLIETNLLTGMEANPDCLNSIVGVIDGKQRILGTCGERYNLVTNEEIFTPIMQKLAGFDHNVSVKTRNNSGFEVKFNILDKKLATNVGNSKDLIFPQISVNRSYDSSSKYSINAGFFRLICSNGLTIPVAGKEHFSYKGKHTEKLNFTIEKMFDVIDSIIESSNKTSKKYDVLYDTKVSNFAERVEIVMEATNIKKGMDDVLATIRTEMAQLGETIANDWLIYNGINRLIFDDNKNVKTDEVRKELDKKVLDFMIVR